jgi:hypothetical protein
MDFWAQYSNELARAGACGTISALLAVGLYFGGRWYIGYRKKHAIFVAKENASAVKDLVLEKGKQAVDVTIDTAKSVADKAKPLIDTGIEKARATVAIAKERFERRRGERKMTSPPSRIECRRRRESGNRPTNNARDRDIDLTCRALDLSQSSQEPPERQRQYG